MYNGKRLAFDFGSVRIGVAVTDNSAILASPKKALANSENLEKALEDFLLEIDPVYIAVGLPKQLSGTEGTKFAEVQIFIETLKRIFSVPIFGIDERYTTVSASSKLREIGRDARTSKDLIDSASAVGILEIALQLEKNGELDKCAL